MYMYIHMFFNNNNTLSINDNNTTNNNAYNNAYDSTYRYSETKHKKCITVIFHRHKFLWGQY